MTNPTKNNNCLLGVRCPNCGFEDKFYIRAEITVEVTDDGTEDLCDGYMWDQNANTQCARCKHEGILDDFTIETQQKNTDNIARYNAAIERYNERTKND